MTDHDDSKPALSPNRRQVLGGLGAAGALSSLGVSLSAPAQAEAHTIPVPGPDPRTMAFLQASALLTGIPLDRSYIELAEALLAALVENTLPRSTIDKVSETVLSAGDGWHQALRVKGLIAPAQDIALIWYTGMTDYRPQHSDDSTVVTYDNALAWRACSFTKPPANCGGPFGYWYDPA